MATEVTIDVYGDVFFRRKIRKMAYRAMDMEPVMHRLGEKVQTIVEEQFATQGVRGGKKWDPLRFDTIARRGSAEPILVETGEMLVEMTDDQVYHAHPDGLEVRIPEGVLQKAESAQYGFHARNGEFIEPRPIINLTEFDKRSFRNKITDFLVNGRL